MKYRKLVSSTTPSDLQEWLGQELDDRGIDSVYARSILSLLQQDCVDIEPRECLLASQDVRHNQLKVLHKHGGPETLYSVTKSKHQKWKTWSKQILLTSNSPCCKSAFSDMERIKKQAAVDCLRSASDYVNDIEELIDEVCIKLKNFKNMKGENEEICLRNINSRKLVDSFFIPPSSPTNEIEKYFAAFPPLNGKLDRTTEVNQHNMKNAWCGNCIMKRKPKAHIPNKCVQPIIPYSSLKPIRNMYQNEQSTVVLRNDTTQNLSLEKSKHNRKNCLNEAPRNWISPARQVILAKKFLNFKIGPWKAKHSCMTRSLERPLENLFLVQIYSFSFNKFQLLHHLMSFTSLDHSIILTKEASDFSPISLPAESTCSDLNNLLLNQEREQKNASKNSTISYQDIILESYMDTTNSVDSLVHLLVPEALCNNIKDHSSSVGENIQFEISSPPNLLEYSKSPHIEITSLEQELGLETLKSSENRMKNICDIFKNTDISSNNLECEISCNMKERLHSFRSLVDMNTEDLPCKCINSAFYTLPRKDNSYELNEDLPLLSGLTFENAEKSHILTDSYEEESNISNILPSNKLEKSLSDDEIFYSDDDSNEIFQSDEEEENLFLSSKTHFQPIQQNFSSVTNCHSEVDLPIKRIRDIFLTENNGFNFNLESSPAKQLIFDNSLLSSEIHVGQKVLKKALGIGRIMVSSSLDTKERSLSSSYEELASLIPSNGEEPSNICITTEQKELKVFQKLTGNGTNTKDVMKPPTHFKVKEKNFAGNSSSYINWSKQNPKMFDEMWLLYWGENHNFIAHTWQKDSDSVGKIENNEQLSNDSQIIAALSKEIKEEGEELLKGICFMPGIRDDTVIVIDHDMLKSEQDGIHSDGVDFSSQAGNFPNSHEDRISIVHQIQDVQNSIIGQTDAENCMPLVDSSFTLDNLKNDQPDILSSIESHDCHVCFDKNSFKASNYPDLSAFPSSYENMDSLEEDHYTEGGGWSLASDSFLNYSSVNPYEISCSLGLNLEDVQSEYSEFFYRRRMRCTSETDEEVKQSMCKQSQSHFHRRMKQKFAARKRPCCFFLQGSCTRSDCKFSHDLSTTTCRFWKEGSCFKGTTCPFLHGYIEEGNKETLKFDRYLSNHSPDHSYSLESESDFPSLSTKSESSKVKSEAINISHVKGIRKNGKGKI